MICGIRLSKITSMRGWILDANMAPFSLPKPSQNRSKLDPEGHPKIDAFSHRLPTLFCSILGPKMGPCWDQVETFSRGLIPRGDRLDQTFFRGWFLEIGWIRHYPGVWFLRVIGWIKHFGTILGPPKGKPKAYLRPSWGHLRPSCSHLKLSWGHLRLALVLSWGPWGPNERRISRERTGLSSFSSNAQNSTAPGPPWSHS